MTRILTLLPFLARTKLFSEPSEEAWDDSQTVRQRLAILAILSVIFVLGFGALHLTARGLDIAQDANLVLASLAVLTVFYALWGALWSKAPIRITNLTIIFTTVLIWADVAFSGGILAFASPLLLIPPIAAAITISRSGTVMVLLSSLVAIFTFTYFTANGVLHPDGPNMGASIWLLSGAYMFTAVYTCTSILVLSASYSNRNQKLEHLLDEHYYSAHHDELSGLANRAMLNHYFDNIEEGEAFDLFVIDLDGFKAVNDTHGHAAGDFLIQQVARRLSDMTNENDLLVRLGGDEFLILSANGNGSAGEVADFGKRLITHLSRRYPWQTENLTISASIGHAAYPLHTEKPKWTLGLADKALYDAKNSGKGRCISTGQRVRKKASAA